MSDTIDLVVPNIAEFNLRHPRLTLDPATVDSFQLFGRAMADQSVFWSRERRVQVLPTTVDMQWFADVHEAMGLRSPPLICPTFRSGRIIEDMLDDAAAMAALRRHLADHKRVQFVSWGATEDLYRLAAAVRGFGHEVLLDVPAENQYWTSLYLDSKASCLDLANQIPGVRVAPGVTVDSWHELRGILEMMRANGDTAIVRGFYGTAGEGSAVVQPEPGALDEFWRVLRDDPLLRMFPLLVQKYLPHHHDFGNPAVDMLIADDGIADLVLSIMTVDIHRFVSVNIGAGLLPSAIADEITDISRQVAAAARRLGFRGWFGIDFLADERGDIHVTEFNARRTGGTQWIPLLDSWQPARDAVAHAQHAIPVPASAPPNLGYPDLRPAFQRLRHQGFLALPVATRLLSHRKRSYGFVTLGADAATAESYADTVRDAIESSLTSSAGFDGSLT
ncbi:hypothetical protein [Actinocrispum wychmicini]|uniref:ATP-grasp domain-containing protein n=1 Tax=Actinocrispum wychmicini TaxID=1213861 RepID=A0A4R2JP24_9PSEU|nr:hypothetical protein [Actinocrispum wychmicini]TCO61893.1 hypothetical protein EV192_10230 [Actinocrispum wychmicini]